MAQNGATLAAEDDSVARHTLRFTPVVADRCGHRTRVQATLALTPPAQSHAACRSQMSTPVHPPWLELTPFWDRWRASGCLRQKFHLGGLDKSGLVFLGLQRRFRTRPRGRVVFSAAIALQLAASQRAAVGAMRNRRAPIRAAENDWRRFFSLVPEFRCSDPFLDRHWWYRLAPQWDHGRGRAELRTSYSGLARYGEWLRRTRDTERAG